MKKKCLILIFLITILPLNLKSYPDIKIPKPTKSTTSKNRPNDIANSFEISFFTSTNLLNWRNETGIVSDFGYERDIIFFGASIDWYFIFFQGLTTSLSFGYDHDDEYQYRYFVFTGGYKLKLYKAIQTKMELVLQTDPNWDLGTDLSFGFDGVIFNKISIFLYLGWRFMFINDLNETSIFLNISSGIGFIF